MLRDVLWDQLREAGYGGKVLRLIQRSYDDNEGNFRLRGIRGRRMGRNRGLRQGCVLSPFLFAIYIRKAVEKLVASKLGVTIGGVRVPALIFADDIVLCARSEIELSKLLGILWQELEKLGLEINEEKSMVLSLGTVRGTHTGMVKSDKGHWQIMVRRERLMVIREGEDYKYLGVFVSNLGIVRKRGEGGGVDEIVRKAQVQAAIVRDEIRDSYDKIREGKMIWERICLPRILYGMEVAEVGDKVLEELEAIQIRLGRVILGASNRIGGETILWELGWLPISKWIVAKKVGFYWRMRGIESNRCSRVIFEDRQNEGWVLRVRALMQVNEMGDDGKFSENNLMLQKLREETMNIWVEDMNERVEGKPNGDVSWRRVYRWRLSWKQEEELVSTRAGAEGLWVKARIGDWDCNLKEWKLGRGVHRCWACGVEFADLGHYMLGCREFRHEREKLVELLRGGWGNERWGQWEKLDEEKKVAEWLGLRGGCSVKHKELMIDFLRDINRKGKEGMEQQLSGQRVVGMRRN